MRYSMSLYVTNKNKHLRVSVLKILIKLMLIVSAFIFGDIILKPIACQTTFSVYDVITSLKLYLPTALLLRNRAVRFRPCPTVIYLRYTEA